MGRAKSEFVVLQLTGGSTYQIAKVGLGSTDEARRWLKKDGEEGKDYQIAAFGGPPVHLQERTTIRRRLVSGTVPSPAQPTKGPDPRD